MESVYLNGGMIGATLDFADTDKYILDTSTIFTAPTYLGGASGIASNGGAISLNLTSLSLQQDDILIVMTAAADAGAEINILSTDVTQIDSYLFGDDTEDITMEFGYLIVGASPPSSISSRSTGDTDNSTVHIIQAFRGVDLTAFSARLFAANGYNTNVGFNTANPTFTSVSIQTDNSIVVSLAASSNDLSAGSYSAPEMTDFITVGANDTYDAVGGMGYTLIETSGGTFTASDWTSADNDTAKAYASAQIVLPAKETTTFTYGNQKNSGIWNLQAVLESLEV